MEPQFGVKRAPVDPFGRELETWLRDAPATNLPYAADLLVPPTTGSLKPPVDGGAEPGHPVVSGASVTGTDEVLRGGANEVGTAAVSDTSTADTGETLSDDASAAAPQAFRRDRGRHASACAPSIPEPPERLALRFDDLAVAVSASTGRTTIERIVVLERELQVRESDLAKLAAWESSVGLSEDPEVTAAREYVRGLFADLVADAADEEAAVARHRQAGAAVTASAAVRPTAVPEGAASEALPTSAVVAAAPSHTAVVPPKQGAARPSSHSSRPIPLVQPATGPSAIDHAAFAAVIGGHTAAAAPSTGASGADFDAPSRSGAATTIGVTGNTDAAAPGESGPAAEVAATQPQPSLWQRFIAGVLRLFGRR